MNDLPGYEKKDFKETSWQDYEKTLQKLTQEIGEYLTENSMTVDGVVPILRGGAFPGGYLAYKLDLLTMWPVQYKYLFKEKIELRRLLPFSVYDEMVPESPTLLVVESNHCFGRTAQAAIDDILEIRPAATILYAADHMDYSNQEMGGVKQQFVGRFTNECRGLTFEKAADLGVMPYSYLLPWEHIDEEWTTVQGEQHEYQDVKTVDTKSALRLTIDEEH